MEPWERRSNPHSGRYLYVYEQAGTAGYGTLHDCGVGTIVKCGEHQPHQGRPYASGFHYLTHVSGVLKEDRSNSAEAA